MPATKALRLWAQAQRERLKEEWANGTYTHTDNAASWAANHGATGAASAYKDFLELDFEVIIGVLEDAQ